MYFAGLCSQSFCSHSHTRKKLGFKVCPSAGLHFDAWDKELLGDPDQEFILHGIKNGFDIIDNNIDIQPVKCRNHPSARPGSALYTKATAQIQTEIEAGNYIICEKPPSLISPIAVIPKPDGNVRLIHDCSHPTGQAVNDYCSSEWKQSFSRVDDVVSLMTPSCYFAKVNLQKAYPSVGISKASQEVTGLHWTFGGKTVYLKDSKLCFGSKLSPGIFHRL